MTYINPAAKLHRHLDRVVDWTRGDKPAPVTVEWDLSNRCSLGCQSCHFAHTHSKGPWTTRDRRLPMAFDPCGDLADIRVVERAVREMAKAGVRSIVWSGGGEPTLHPEWMRAMQAARDAGLQQGLYTLGGHLSEREASWLSDTLAWVVVSLDAADADTYAAEKGVPKGRFDAACGGLAGLSGGRAVVGASFLLHAGNITRTEDMLALARRLGATYTTFRPTIETSPDRPGVPGDRSWLDTQAFARLSLLEEEPDVEIDVNRFAQYAHWQGHGYDVCTAGRFNATVTPDGRVWFCLQRRGVLDSLIGDLSQESFEDIWARHPGAFRVNAGCRVMCRLHPINLSLHALERPRVHEAFL